MNISPRLTLACFMLSSFLVHPAKAQNAGLWVGHVLVDAVSEVNKPRSDLSFNLQLEGYPRSDISMFIAAGAEGWSYNDAGDELPAEWRDLGYDHSGWSIGSAQLGYGDGDETTVISSGPSPEVKNPVTYFRKVFAVTNPSVFTHLDISLLRDDGAVVYLNGQEIMRSNMPSGPVDYLTPPVEGVASSGENRFILDQVLADGLVAGNNVVAVEVHQHEAELTPFEGTAPPSPTASLLSLRVLLHVDAAGNVRLLKHVIQMWKDGTLNADGTLATEGHYVLITKDELIPQYKGIAPRDGSMVGRRISAVGYDFPGETVGMDGLLVTGGIVRTSVPIEIPPEHPTHPLRHRYHPDHDNLDATYSVAASEVGAIGRSIDLEVSARYPPDPDESEGSPPPGWGETELGGIYRETVTGLHRDPIVVKGVFTLTRVTEIAELNP